MSLRRRLLLLLTSASVFAQSEDIYVDTSYGSRTYFCRDQFGYIGDCRGGGYQPQRDFTYGYPQDSVDGRKVGEGHFNLIQYQHAELVCDFLRDGRVNDDIVNIVWRKVFSDYGGRRGRTLYSGGYNHYRDDRSDYLRRDALWSRDQSYNNNYNYNSAGWQSLRGGGARSYGLYRPQYNARPRYIDGWRQDMDPWYYRDDEYRPIWSRDAVPNYDDWYSSSRFRSSTRVYTQGARSILYIRDFGPADYGRYRCIGTRKASFPYPAQTVYIDVDFYDRMPPGAARAFRSQRRY